MEKLPSDRAYENGVQCKETLLSRVELNGDVWNGIDWNQQLDATGAEQDATGFAATQFHYANTAHLILCGRVLKHELPNTTVDAQKLAISLSSHKIEDADIWGRYLHVAGTCASVGPLMREYYRNLFSEDELPHLFVGMETLGGPVARAVYAAVQDSGDRLFQQITANMVDQKEQEIRIATEHIAPLLDKMSDETLQDVAETAEMYGDLIERVLYRRRDEFTALDVNIKDLQEDAQHHVTQFYQELGLL